MPAASPGPERRPVLVVDAANVIGSVPDGWWRDRAGAVRRLRDSLGSVAADGLPGLPGPVEVVLVVEGAARAVEPVSGVSVVAAPRSGDGDDAIVRVVADRRAEPVYVVTADRKLRERVSALGAAVLRPKALLGASHGRDPS
ncbi:MAG TPA: NTP pyrophosphohydrolase [Actinomycetes bacterium]|nr:NTP pyrophosphohydrolase [Actinomycetes bacterium]